MFQVINWQQRMRIATPGLPISTKTDHHRPTAMGINIFSLQDQQQRGGLRRHEYRQPHHHVEPSLQQQDRPHRRRHHLLHFRTILPIPEHICRVLIILNVVPM